MSRVKQISDIFEVLPNLRSKSNPYKLEIWKKVPKGEDYYDECGRVYCIKDYLSGKTAHYISVRVVASGREVGRIPEEDRHIDKLRGKREE